MIVRQSDDIQVNYEQAKIDYNNVLQRLEDGTADSSEVDFLEALVEEIQYYESVLNTKTS